MTTLEIFKELFSTLGIWLNNPIIFGLLLLPFPIIGIYYLYRLAFDAYQKRREKD